MIIYLLQLRKYKMWVRYTKNLWTIYKKYINKWKLAINLWLDTLKKEIDINTPEDTKTLLKNNEITEAKEYWWSIVWKVENETEYWSYVEFWVWWRQFNYHKPKWSVFHKWVWARMYTRWFDNSESELKKIFRDTLKYK